MSAPFEEKNWRARGEDTFNPARVRRGSIFIIHHGAFLLSFLDDDSAVCLISTSRLLLRK